jgi:hypothetical protein
MERRRQQRDKKIKINLPFKEALALLAGASKQNKLDSILASEQSSGIRDGDKQMESPGVYDNQLATNNEGLN